MQDERRTFPVELKDESSTVVQQTTEERYLTADEKRLLENGEFTGEMLKATSFAGRTCAQLEKIERGIPYFWKR